MIQYRFSTDKAEFLKILSQRVDDYFNAQEISRNANTIYYGFEIRDGY